MRMSGEMAKYYVPQLIRGLGYDPRYNEMTKDIQDGDDVWEESYDAIIENELVDIASARYIGNAVKIMAWENRFNPIDDWMDSLEEWDGTDWIHKLCSYFENPDGMFEIYLKKWMIGAIDRVTKGGTRNPMLVLDGMQQSGKSSFVKWLCPEPLQQYFREGQIRPDDKDHRLALIKTFIWEIGEIDATTKRADASALKDFITISAVKERGAYDQRSTDRPTICSFIGTFNNVSGFLTDPTGSTRYRVCKLGKINWIGYTTDPDELADKIWSQAVALWRKGETNTLNRDEEAMMNKINAGYVLQNNTRFALEEYFNITPGSEDFTSSNYIREVLQNHGLHGADIDARRVAGCLLELGCTPTQKKSNGINKRGWFGISKRLDAEIE